MAFRTNKTPVLQEKTASGSVATFNTALAMPLPSCNIAVNAWQEGSGDPSPSNVRAIHGFSEVNAYQRAVNLWDEEWELGSIDNTTGQPEPSNYRIRTKNYIPVAPNTKYYMTVRSGYRYAYDINKTYIGTFNIDNPTPSNCYFIKFRLGNDYGTTYNHDISINYPSTDTDYHAYTGNTYTIQLGQEVYGGVLDVLSGVLTVTHEIVEYDENSTWYINGSNGVYMIIPTKYRGNKNILVSKYKYATNKTAGSQLNDDECCINYTGDSCLIKDNEALTVNDFKTALGVTPMYINWVLASPITIQLTPTQIETLIGNNTIFADTGDTSVVYNDLDLAKRGSFREVFKLPS